ncbi:MAG: carbohydrate ABC transporter permease [Actinobacteria bacterium]|nr:MAG: carbohydrate ABC transporter permease [Actinomycetota bacterium]
MRSRTRTVSMYGAIVFALVIGLFPIWWMIVTSFKQPVDIYSGVSLVPQHFTMDNYAELFQDRHFGSYLGNSLVVVALSVGISLAVGTLGAYALTRSRIGELIRRLSLVGALVVRMVPPILLAIPVYIVLGKLGLLDTKLGLIFVYAGLNASLVVWMMESYLGEIPPEIEEAAGMVATAIFSVIVTYNEFLLALSFTSTPNSQTITVGVSTLIGKIQIEWGPMAAAGVIGAVPIIVFALLVQRHFVRGLTLGAIK